MSHENWSSSGRFANFLMALVVPFAVLTPFIFAWKELSLRFRFSESLPMIFGYLPFAISVLTGFWVFAIRWRTSQERLLLAAFIYAPIMMWLLYAASAIAIWQIYGDRV